MKIARLSLLLALSASALSACDPCFGVAGCRADARVSYSGRTIDRTTGQPVSGVVVEFARTGGVPLAADLVTARSDGEGWFRLAADADSAGEVVGDLTVRGRTQYTVRGVRLRTTVTEGDGGDFGRIVVDPYVAYVGEVWERRTRSVVPGASVVFRRTGGVRVTPEVATLATDKSGRFLFAPTVTEIGTVTGEFVISAPSLPKAYRVPVTITTEFKDRDADPVAVLRLGAALQYVGEVWRRGDYARTRGMRAEFRRTGGIPLVADTYESVTQEYGLFPILLEPLAEGEVIGDLTIHPPAPEPPLVVRGLRLRTHEDDALHLAGQWSYGLQVFGAVEFFYRATGQKVDSGAKVLVRGSAGVRVQPDTVTETVNQFGAMKVQFAALDSGQATFDFVLRLPAPYGVDTVRGLSRGTTRRDDVQQYLGRFGVGMWLPYIGIVRRAGSGEPVVGARIEFRRTGGVAITPAVYTSTSNDFGGFPLTAAPAGDGEVIGDLTIRPPAPLRELTVTGLRLQTSRSDALKVAGTWDVSP